MRRYVDVVLTHQCINMLEEKGVRVIKLIHCDMDH